MAGAAGAVAVAPAVAEFVRRGVAVELAGTSLEDFLPVGLRQRAVMPFVTFQPEGQGRLQEPATGLFASLPDLDDDRLTLLGAPWTLSCAPPDSGSRAMRWAGCNQKNLGKTTSKSIIFGDEIRAESSCRNRFCRGGRRSVFHTFRAWPTPCSEGPPREQDSNRSSLAGFEEAVTRPDMERTPVFVPEIEEVSLIITAHRGGPMLEACLKSAAKLDPQPREVIVTIDGDDSAVIEAAKSLGFSVVSNPGAPGVSAARNAGAKGATGSVLIFADSDVLLPRNHTARLAQAFEDHRGVAAVIGSYDDLPAAPGIVSRYRNLLHHHTHQHGSGDAKTFWAGCGAIRRDAFNEIGGFDESYRLPSVEDIELGYRLRRTGASIRLVPSWQVKHLKRWRLRDLVTTDISRRAIPWTRLLRREGRLDDDLNTDRNSRVSALFVVLGISALLISLMWHPALTAAVAAMTIPTTINWPFYRFLARCGGWPFAIASIPLHWLYFLSATAGFCLGSLPMPLRDR